MAFEGDGAADGAAGGDGGATGGGAADLFGAGAGATGGAAEGGAAGEGGADGGAEGGGGADPDWFEKISAEAGEGETASNRDWLKAKGVKDLDGLTKIARDTERALRAGGKITIPGENAKPDEVAAFKAAIGVPDKVDGYEVKGPEGVPLNEPLINSLRESALNHGTPKAAFEGMVSDFIKLQMDEAAATDAKQIAEANDWLKAQGSKADEQRAHIDAAARGLGLSRDDMLWFRSMPGGAGRALDKLAQLGAGMAEDTLITGGKNRFGVTGAEAIAEIEKLKLDSDFQAKVMTPGSAERLRWDRLNAAAAEARARQDQQL